MAFAAPGIAGAVPSTASMWGAMPFGVPQVLPLTSNIIPTGIGAIPAVPVAAVPQACAMMYGPVANVCNAATATTQVTPYQTVTPMPNMVMPQVNVGVPLGAVSPVPTGIPALPMGKGVSPWSMGVSPLGMTPVPLGGMAAPTIGVSPWGVGVGFGPF